MSLNNGDGLCMTYLSEEFILLYVRVSDECSLEVLQWLAFCKAPSVDETLQVVSRFSNLPSAHVMIRL